MPISEKVKNGMAQGSWIRRMFEEGNLLKQRYGAANVFDLSLGNPVVEPPAEFHEELRKLAEKPVVGMHRYMENAGYLEARAAVAGSLSSETGLRIGAQDVVMTCGAAGALNVVLKTILNPGEEVIVFSPFFVEYLNYIDNHGGAGKIVETGEGFLPDPARLAAAIGPKTKAIIVNSPNNPTGVVYSESCLRDLCEVIRTRESSLGTQIFLISDEPYKRIIYDGLVYPHVLPHHRRAIIVTSHSKDFALPGERIGYIAVHPDTDNKQELMDGLVYCNRILGYVNAPALMQHVVMKLQSVTVSITDYQRKRDKLYTNLTSLGFSVVKPQGAFYLFPKSPIEDEVEFIRELQEYKVLAVPGRGFGRPGYFRVSYCVDDHTIDGAIEGFREVASRHSMGR